jgi:hypothetical protein
VIRQDLTTNFRSLFVVNNRLDGDVHKWIPAPDIALYRGKIVRLQDQDPSVGPNGMPPANDLDPFPRVSSFL